VRTLPAVLTALVAVAAFLPIEVHAKNPPPADLLEAARELAKGDNAVAAEEAFGKAARAAHDRADPLVERDVSVELIRLLAALESDPEALQSAVRAAITQLDPKRTGAFVSVPGLGLDALYVATKTGKLAAAAETAAHVAAWAGAGKKRPCQAAHPIGLYAAAIRTAADTTAASGERTTLADGLEEARQAAADMGFFELLSHVSTELAAQAHAAGDSERALAALQKSKSALPTSEIEGQLLLAFWGMLLHERLGEDAKPYTDALGLGGPRKSASAGGDGGAGGAGGAGGSGPARSPIGMRWDKLKGKSPIVTLERTAGGFGVKVHFAKKLDADEGHDVGFRVRSIGGVHLGFCGPSAGLWKVDLRGRDGLDGSSPVRPRYRALHLLAEGESVTFSKKYGLTFSR